MPYISFPGCIAMAQQFCERINRIVQIEHSLLCSQYPREPN